MTAPGGAGTGGGPGRSAESGPGEMEPYVAFVVSALALSGFTLYLLSSGYVNADAVGNWASVIGTVSADEVRLEHFGLVYPHLPLYTLVPFYFLEPLRSPAAPYLLSSVMGALLLAHLYTGLRERGWDRIRGGLLLLLVAVHPAFLWSVTNGSAQAMSLLFFYFLIVSSLRLRTDGSSRVHMVLGTLLAIYFFADPRTMYVAASLLLLLVLVGSREMLAESALSMYVVVFLPYVFAFLAWTYLGWMALESPWIFLSDPTSAFRGAASYAEFVPWLRSYGGDLLVPLAVGVAGSALCAPLLAWLAATGEGVEDGLDREAALFALSVPAVTLAIATFTNFAAHPALILFLVAGSVAAVLRRLRPGRVATPILALLLLAGAVGGWTAFERWSPEAEGERWIAAARGDSVEAVFRDELVLGQWLQGKEGVLMGTEVGYPAIVARGRADGLLLPYTTPYQVALVSGQLGSNYVAVPDPTGGQGGLAPLNRAFPRLYEAGYPGYVRVYDNRNWRVYRREGVEGPPPVRTLDMLPTGVVGGAQFPPEPSQSVGGR